MTSVLGQNDNNGSVVGPENNPTVDADQTTEITSSTTCLLYTSPSPRDLSTSRMPSSA